MTGRDPFEGVLVPEIERRMRFLDEWCPPAVFPSKGGVRTPEHTGQPWLRGGTSPSGQIMGSPSEANYYIGAQYVEKEWGQPWRIVWIPPRRGEETYIRPDSLGPHMEGDNPTPGVVFKRWGARIMPVRVNLWCNDYGDLDVLVQWVTTAHWQVSGGGPEAVGIRSVVGGGIVEEVEDGDRGLIYEMTLNFAAPLVSPWYIAKQGRIVITEEMRPPPGRPV